MSEPAPGSTDAARDSDAAHDSDSSAGTPSETAPGAGSPEAGTIDGQEDVDLIDGVLSPGSSAIGGPTEPADPA